MRKKKRFNSRPKMQCGICKIIVDTKPRRDLLEMVDHNPDTGEKVSDPAKSCIGTKFPNMAKPLLDLDC